VVLIDWFFGVLWFGVIYFPVFVFGLVLACCAGFEFARLFLSDVVV